MRVRSFASVFVLAAALLASSASADTILSGFVGKTFGGGADVDFGDSSHLVYGGTLSLLGDGALGLEIDGQYSPHFFGGADGSNVASLMGELTLGGGEPQGARFYLAAGAGILKSRVADRSAFIDADRDSFGIALGASAIVPLSGPLGVKGDVRYFRGLTNVKPDTVGEIDLTGFHFWRGSVGVALRL